MTRLLLVRHGNTDFNNSRRFCGHTDTELSPVGLEQVTRLRDRLANEKIDAVYCSDLKRARDTAAAIVSAHHLEMVACPELREMYYGDCEGLTFDEIADRYPEVARTIRQRTLQLEFPGGESFDQLRARVHNFLDRLEKHGPEDSVLVVAHSAPLKLLICELLGIHPDHWWQLGVDNSSVTLVDTYPGGAILGLLNDTAHLKAGADR